jgi:sugar transferase (PEP-CTERM/EpsH1 system associated)
MLHALAPHAEIDLVSLVHDDDEESHAADLRDVVSSVTVGRVSRIRSAIRGIGALPGATPLTHAMLDAPGLRTTLEQLVATRPPDVVLSYCSGIARFAVEPPLSSFPHVLDMVDVDSAKWSALAAHARGPRKWIYKREVACLAPFEARVALSSHATIVVNEREQAELMKLAPSARTVVVRNGVDIDFFRPAGPPAAGAQVVFCGVFNYAPNEDAALWFLREVWPAVLAARSDATLALVGAHPTRVLRDAADRATRVDVTGAVPDVRPYLWGSAVAIAPIWTARGVQNKVLEAVAAGLPTVVTPAVMGGLPTHVLPACTAAATPDEFAKSVLAVLAAPPEARRAIARSADLTAMRWSERLSLLIATLEAAAQSSHHATAAATITPDA